MSNIIDISKPDYITPIKYGFLAACVIGIFGWAYSFYCSECSGTGTVQEKVSCPTCNGTKEVSCPVYVKKETKCYNCKTGKVEVKCSACNGTGKDIVILGLPITRCGTCKGSGNVDIDCNRCGGKQTITEDTVCGKCMGKGKIKCGQCNGKGYDGYREIECTKCKHK